MPDLEKTSRTESAFNKPAYRYIRDSDHLPTIDAVADEADPMVRVKLFNPTGIGTWYLMGYDPEDRIAFGLCNLFEWGLGDVSMAELVDVRGMFGLPIERDIHFTPQLLSEVKKRVGYAY